MTDTAILVALALAGSATTSLFVIAIRLNRIAAALEKRDFR